MTGDQVHAEYPICEALRISGQQCQKAAVDGHVHDREGTPRRVCPLHRRKYYEPDGFARVQFVRRRPEYAR